MRPVRPLILSIAAVCWTASPALAHKGALDELGCHKDRISSYYHCHEGPLAGKRFPMKTAAERALKSMETEQAQAAEEQADLDQRVAAAVAAQMQAQSQPQADPVAAPAPAAPLPDAPDAFGPYRATLVRVADATTVDVDVHVWPGQIQRVQLRLDGVYGPDAAGAECERADAAAAKAFVSGWVAGAGDLVVSAVRPASVAGLFVGRLARDGRDLGTELVAAGHARADEGAWCAP